VRASHRCDVVQDANMWECTETVRNFYSDDHTLVSFYRKRVTCSCLDAKHKEVKSINKMGYCNNDQCPLPGRRAERKDMVYCILCGYANYCSRECQEAAWPEHKGICKELAQQTAKLEHAMRNNGSHGKVEES
jgi:hypothetical protein